MINSLVQQILTELPGMLYSQKPKGTRNMEHFFIDTVMNCQYATHTNGYVRRTTFKTPWFNRRSVRNNYCVNKKIGTRRKEVLPSGIVSYFYDSKLVMLGTEAERLKRILEIAKKYRN